MNETSYSNTEFDGIAGEFRQNIRGNTIAGIVQDKSPKKPWYSFLTGPWLWWAGVLLGNVSAFVTFVSYLVDGNISVLLWGPFLYPFWIIIVAVVATIPLGIVFTCGVVAVKSMIAMYRALPFRVVRGG